MVLRELVNIIGYEIDEAAFKDVQGRSQALFEGIESFGKNMTMKVTAPIVAAAALAVNEFTNYKTALAIVEQRIKSTGGAAGETSKDLEDMSRSLQQKSLFTHVEILKNAEGTLLRFDNIHKDVFERATKAVVNLAADDGDLRSSALLLGRALQNPAESVQALTRRGVRFSAVQREVIKGMIAQGRTADAQRYILSAVEKSTGDIAEAMRKSSSGFKIMRMELQELGEKFGELLLPYFQKFYGFLVKIIDKIKNLSPATKKLLIVVGSIAAAIGPAALALGMIGNLGLSSAKGLSALINGFKMLGGVVGVTSIAALGWVALIVAALAVLFLIVDDFMNYMKGGDSIIGKFLAPWSELGPKIMAKMQPIIDFFKGMFIGAVEIVRGLLQIVAGLFSGNADTIVKGIKNIVRGLWDFLLDFLGLVFQMLGSIVPLALKIFEKLGGAILDWAGRLISSLWDKIKTVPFLGSLLSGIGNMFSGGGGGLLTGGGMAPSLTGMQAGMNMFRPSPAAGSTSKSVNVNSTIAMTVPAGTEQHQIAAVKSAAEQATAFAWNNHLRMAFLQVQQ